MANDCTRSTLPLGATNSTAEHSHCLRVSSLIIITFHNVVVVVVTNYARRRPGDMFLGTTAVVLAEVGKLMFCLLAIFIENRGNVYAWMEELNQNVFSQPKEHMKVAIPSFMYTIQNNLVYVALSHLDAAVFQVTYQLKLLTASIFSVVILRKQLSRIQWVSLVILFVGIAIVQKQPINTSVVTVKLDSFDMQNMTKYNASTIHQSQSSKFRQMLTGTAAVFTACTVSGYAGVYLENVLKNTSVSIFVRNVQLANIGFIVSLTTALLNNGTEIAHRGFLHGYDILVWVIIILQSFGGLTVAVVLKYADSILRGFATSFSVVITCMLSYFSFHVMPTAYFFVGASLVVSSTILYNTNLTCKCDEYKIVGTGKPCPQ